MLISLLKKIKDWWTFRSLTQDFDKEVDQNVNMWNNSTGVNFVQEDQDVQQKYTNGLVLMKQRLREIQGSDKADEMLKRFTGSKDFYVGNDLLSLAIDEDRSRKALREVKEAAFVYSGADVKTEEDKVKMIDERIGHYTHLQKDKLARDTLKEARAAWASGDIKLHKQLLAKWEEIKYGKSRNSSSRN